VELESFIKQKSRQIKLSWMNLQADFPLSNKNKIRYYLDNLAYCNKRSKTFYEIVWVLKFTYTNFCKISQRNKHNFFTNIAMILFEIWKWTGKSFAEKKTVFNDEANLDLSKPVKQHNFTIYSSNNPDTAIKRLLYFDQI